MSKPPADMTLSEMSEYMEILIGRKIIDALEKEEEGKFNKGLIDSAIKWRDRNKELSGAENENQSEGLTFNQMKEQLRQNAQAAGKSAGGSLPPLDTEGDDPATC